MRNIKIIPIYFFVACLTSCDYTVYVGIRNFKQPCRVNVEYQRVGNPFFDKDTLFVKDIEDAVFDSSCLRVNTSSNSYYFIAPNQREVALRPVALGTQPITNVSIINSPDSIWTINLWDRKQVKQLKKSGQIKTKGFIYTRSILIENQLYQSQHRIGALGRLTNKPSTINR